MASTQIPITHPRIKDNQWLWEAFSGVNNNRQYGDFTISDNYWIYLQILASFTGDMQIKGDIDCSTNPNYPEGTKGDVYRVSVAGKIGGASGMPVSVGNLIVCFVTAVTGTQAAVGSSWNITNVGLQRVFEVALATGDLTQTVVRDWTGTIGRNVSLGITGTFALAATNFAVTAAGLVGINKAVPTASLDVVGQGATSATFSATFVNSAAVDLFKIRNDGAIYAGNVLTGTTVVSNNLAPAAFTFNTIFGTGAGGTSSGGFNTAFGGSALASATAGDDNAAFGRSSLRLLTTGTSNTACGTAALENNGTGSYNTGCGRDALGGTLGNSNVGLGYRAGYSHTTGSNCTYVGAAAGLNATGTDGSVFIGSNAGRDETGSNKLFIDNQNRATEANSRLQALVYGIFDAATANQFFTVNGHVLIREDLQFTTKGINITAGDAATINSPAGRFRKDNSGTTFTLTNSYITANSIIQLTPANAAVDATALTWTVLAGGGSAVITFGAAPAADFDMNFLVIN